MHWSTTKHGQQGLKNRKMIRLTLKYATTGWQEKIDSAKILLHKIGSLMFSFTRKFIVSFFYFFFTLYTTQEYGNFGLETSY